MSLGLIKTRGLHSDDDNIREPRPSHLLLGGVGYLTIKKDGLLSLPSFLMSLLLNLNTGETTINRKL